MAVFLIGVIQSNRCTAGAVDLHIFHHQAAFADLCTHAILGQGAVFQGGDRIFRTGIGNFQAVACIGTGMDGEAVEVDGAAIGQAHGQRVGHILPQSDDRVTGGIHGSSQLFHGFDLHRHISGGDRCDHIRIRRFLHTCRCLRLLRGYGLGGGFFSASCKRQRHSSQQK